MRVNMLLYRYFAKFCLAKINPNRLLLHDQILFISGKKSNKNSIYLCFIAFRK